MMNRKLFLKLFLLMSLILVLPGSAFSKSASMPKLEQVEEGNFILHVATDDNVKIKVFIDGKLAALTEFKQRKDNVRVSIPSHQVFQFNLSKGKHVIQAESDKKGEVFRIPFQTKVKTWAILYYVDVNKIKGTPGAITQPFSLELRDSEIMYE